MTSASGPLPLALGRHTLARMEPKTLDKDWEPTTLGEDLSFQVELANVDLELAEAVLPADENARVKNDKPANEEDPSAEKKLQIENCEGGEPNEDDQMPVKSKSLTSSVSRITSLPSIVFGQPIVDLPTSFCRSWRAVAEKEGKRLSQLEEDRIQEEEKEYKSVRPLTELTYAVLAIGLNALVCYLAFGLAPMHDIRKDYEIKYWYECALACSLIWVPANIYNVMLLGNATLFRGFEKKCGIIYFAKAWIPGGIIMSACQYFYANYFAWPTPWLFVLTACPVIYCVAGGMMYFEIPKEHRVEMRLKTAVFSFYAFMAVVGLLLTVCAAGYTNMLMRFASEMDGFGMALMIVPTCALLPIMRMCNVFILQWLGRWVHDDLLIFALLWCTTAHAACIPIALGGDGGVVLVIAFVATDISLELMALLCAFGGDLYCCGWKLATRESYLIFLTQPLKVLLRSWRIIPKRELTRAMITSLENRWLLTFITMEQGDILVPTSLTAGWLTIYYAGQRNAFAGIGNDEMGFERPEATNGEGSRVVNFVTNVAIFVILNIIVGVMLQLFMQIRFKLNIHGAQKWMLKKFGWEMLIQSVVIIYTILCLLHITCAIDISFRFKPVADPWGWFQSDQIPAMYVSRGHNATRPW